MLKIRDHNVGDYAALRDMDTTDVAALDEADRGCLDELGRFLVSADAWPRLAIWLLHKHFEPTSGEVFVETVVAAPRGTRTTPVQRCFVPGLNPVSLRFNPVVSSGVALIGMEFAGPAAFARTSSVSADDESVLAGIAERLRAHGKTERFGVRLIRNPLGLSESEVLVETCDIAHRSLHCSVAGRDVVLDGNSVETTWQWRPGPDTTKPDVKLYCIMMCGSQADGSHYIEGHTTIPD